MPRHNLPVDQAAGRAEFLQAIVASDSPRKLVVAGPGTGKTYTFAHLLRSRPPGSNLALTFIRKLVADMTAEFGHIAEVKTFHAYCKMLLHKRFGRVELAPYLTLVVEEDATHTDLALSDFSDAFQTLQEGSPEVAYYLQRGNYYRAVSFDDSVFRVYQALNDGSLTLPAYDQIVVDEFQDFNPLEVAFINQLEQAGPILIAGDDDQAVYSLRNSSPDFLRDKYQSGQYDVFQLPYCSRCPAVVVHAASRFVDSVVASGGFSQRIPREFVPYLEDKAYENGAYPQILAATTANIAGTSSFLLKAIDTIRVRDIQDSHENAYPTALIVGQRQYLNPISKRLRHVHPYAAFSEAEAISYSLGDGYALLLADEHSNLGWRVLAGSDLRPPLLRAAILASQDGTDLVTLLPREFVQKHFDILEILRAQVLGQEEEAQITALLGDNSAPVIGRFFPPQEPEQPERDLTRPTILLSSFEGCKGLSAGHVFIVGLNEGEIPRITPDGEISDIECCKFLVALTRARKSVSLLSNKWHYSPGAHSFSRSPFIDMIPSELLKDGGYMKAGAMDAFLSEE